MKEVLTALEGLDKKLNALEGEFVDFRNTFNAELVDLENNMETLFDNINKTFDKIFTLLYLIIGVIVFNFIYYFLKVNDFFIN